MQKLINYQNLYDLMPLGYFVINQQGQIVNVNKSGSTLLGVGKAFLTNRAFTRYLAPESQIIFSDFWRQMAHEDKDHSCVLRLLNKNGPIFYAKLFGKKLSEGLGDAQLFLLVVAELANFNDAETEAYENSQQLAHFGQANSVNALAVTVTQQLNHPYGVISNFIHGCLYRINSGNYQIKDIQYALQQASEQLKYAAEIFLRLKNFSYKSTKLEEVCLNSLLQTTLGLIEHEHSDFPVEIQYRPLPGSPRLNLDKIHIQQVLINLIRNALEAMRDDNTPQPSLMIEGTQISKDFIEVSVSDNGPGFSLDLTHRLFDPQFTTKTYGVGMGLAISRSIIETHGGVLMAELAEKRGGACFKFTLPL